MYSWELCHLAWADQRSPTHFMEARSRLVWEPGFKQDWYEVCFNWVWMVQLTQHCLYMDSAGYMKHSYMTRNLCTEQDKKKAVCVLLVQHSIEACANLLVALCNGLLNTFVSTKPHSNSSNTLDTLELHATLLTPDLARYSHVHACKLCKKKWFYHVRAKTKLSSLFVLVFFD